MNPLTCEARIIPTPGTPAGDVLEITFRGIHECTHGSEMNRYVEEKLAETRPAAILFNWLDYEYAFGNDVVALFVTSSNREGKTARPICVVVTGPTQQSLCNLLTTGRLLDVLKIEFASSLELGLQNLRKRIGSGTSALK